MWVSTVTRYLSTTTHPHMKLAALLSGRCKSSIPTEKMDELYSDILGACDWRDEDFVAGYHIFVGAIMAVKTPLSLSALQILHRSTTVLQANEVLQTLRSLFTGLSDQSQPIRTLHVSLREFLTCRAQHLSRHERFYVNEKEHSERLALLCLLVLSEGLGRGIAGMGYLSAPALDKRGIPKMAEGVVTEELWYACRFWMDHVVEIEDPKPALINALCTFLSARFSAWMEVVTSKGRFHSLRQLREWLQKTVQRQTELADSARNFEVAVQSLKGLSERLSYMDRREEALEAIQAAVDFYELQRLGEVGVSSSQTAGLFNDLSLRLSDLGRREEALEIIQQAVRIYYQLEGDLLVYPMPELPLACRNLSICLSAVGRGEDALEVAQEAVNLFRQTSAVAFNAGLARSLSTLSTAFQNQDRPGEALAAIQQSVELFQPLAVENPTEFNSDLAKSLSNLSSCLWKLNRWMDAIGPIIQAVEICRQLAAERPAAFLSQLANTLINFSVCQCLDRGAALHASQEAIELYRQLASDRPAAFTADLANSLVNHSTCLSSMGLDEGALKAIQEAVQLYRSLSADQPIIFTQDLTSSLDRLSHCLSSLGHSEKAQDINQERYGLLCSLVLSRVIRQHAREMEGGE